MEVWKQLQFVSLSDLCVEVEIEKTAAIYVLLRTWGFKNSCTLYLTLSPLPHRSYLRFCVTMRVAQKGLMSKIVRRGNN